MPRHEYKPTSPLRIFLHHSILISHVKLITNYIASLLIFNTLIIHFSVYALPEASSVKTPYEKNTSHQKFSGGKNDQIRLEQDNMNACLDMNPDNLQAPLISVYNTKQSSAFKGGKYQVEGVIEGVCIKEAGLYENGKRIVKFPLETSPYYKRFKFQIEIAEDNNPEIRAFNINWRRNTRYLLPKRKDD